MNTSSRFTVAVHAVTLIAVRPTTPLTSELIACSVSANAVTIRHVLGALREAGLVTSRPGNAGGWSLARDAASISLSDIYRAVEEDTLFPLHHQPPLASCVVGKNIQTVLRPRFAAARQALEQQLARTTVADLAHDVTCTEAGEASSLAPVSPATP